MPGQQIAALKRTIRRSCCCCCWGFELFFPPRTVSCWMAVYLSLAAAAVFLLHSFLPHHHRHSIRNYTWLYTLCLCLSADCSYYSHLLGFPALPCLDFPCLCLCLLFLDGCSTHQGTNPLLLSSDVIHQLDSHFCFPRGLCLLLQQRT